jgi:hypothetical protein
MYTTGQFVATDKSKPGFYTQLKTSSENRTYSAIGVVSIMAAVNAIPVWPEDEFLVITSSNIGQKLAHVVFEDDKIIRELISEILMHSNTVIIHCVKSFDKNKPTENDKRYGFIYDDTKKETIAKLIDNRKNTQNELIGYSPTDSATLGPAGFKITMERVKGDGDTEKIVVSTIIDGKVVSGEIASYAPGKNTYDVTLASAKEEGSLSIPIEVQVYKDSSGKHFEFTSKKTYSCIYGGYPDDKATKDAEGYAYSVMMDSVLKTITVNESDEQVVEETTGKGQLMLKFTGSEDQSGFNYIEVKGLNQGSKITLYRADFYPEYNITAIIDRDLIDTDDTLEKAIDRLGMGDTLVKLGDGSADPHFYQSTTNNSFIIPLVFGFQPRSYLDLLKGFAESMLQHNSAIAYLTNWSEDLSSGYTLEQKGKAYKDVQHLIGEKIVTLDLPTQLLMDQDRVALAEGETEAMNIGFTHPCLISLRSCSHGAKDGYSMQVGAWVAGALAGCGPSETIMARKYNGSIVQFRSKMKQEDVEKSDAEGLLVFHRELGETMIYLDRSSFINGNEKSYLSDIGDRTQYNNAFTRNQTIRLVNSIKSQVRTLFLTKYITSTLNDLTLITLESDVLSILESISLTGAISRPVMSDVSASKVDSRSAQLNVKVVINQTMEILYLLLEV